MSAKRRALQGPPTQARRACPPDSRLACDLQKSSCGTKSGHGLKLIEASRRPVTACARTIAVASGKGGVGKTLIAASLAVALARAGKSTMLLDANLGLANIDFVLDLDGKPNLVDVIKGTTQLEEILIDGPAGLKVVPAGLGNSRMPELGLLEQMGLISAFSNLRARPDYMVVDCAPGIGSSVLSFCAASDAVVVVICDEPASIVHACALVRVLAHERAVESFQIICNRVESQLHGRRLFESFCNQIDECMDFRLSHAASIPEDDVFAAIAWGRNAPFQFDPRSPAAAAITKLADSAVAWQALGVSSGRQSFFVSDDAEAAECLPRVQVD